MKVLVTGAGGFIGSHLAEKCVERGLEVRALVRYNSKNYWGWLESSERREDMDIVTGDVRDYDSVAAQVKGVDAVFHLAALIGIPYSYLSPLSYVQTNVVGTYNILQASRDFGTRQVIITSTSETYGTAQRVPIDESHPIVAQSPYSATKIAADQLALSYYRSFAVPVKIVRPFNTYGPRQSARAIIPNIISQLLADPGMVKVGNLTPTRDLTYVEDTASAFLDVMNAEGLEGQVVNVGMNQETSVKDLIDIISGILGVKPAVRIESERIRPTDSEVERLRCDNAKILAKTSWMPRFDLKDGLAKTVRWLERNRSWYKPGIYNV
jgi:NAD dependent epimerase/dehydratase